MPALLDLDPALNRPNDDGNVTTLQTVELGVLGPLQVRQYGLPVAIPGAKPRAILTVLGLHGGSVVSADTLVELLWGDDPPRTAAKALQTHISSLRRTLGDGFVLTEGTGWTLSTTEIDATRYKLSARLGRDAVAAGDASQAVARFDEALTLWRGTPELPDGSRGVSEKTRWIEGHAALVEDRADALLATGRAAEIIGDLEAAVAEAPLRERRWGQLMLALYRAGRQGEALGAYQRARALLADELGVDPGPDLRRLEAAIVAQDAALEMPVSEQLSAVTRAVTFLLTDIEGSTAAWEADADAMAAALARHDELVEQVVTSRGGRLIKTRGEGDATFSVFDRPSAAAAAAIELQEAIRHEPWALSEPMRIRVALHTGEVELRDGDYFGRAVNRAARLRSLAAGGQILCSGATAELVIDSLSDDVILADLGMRQLRNLARPEHVFELRFETADDVAQAVKSDEPMERPGLPAVLAGPGPFVGRGSELERLLAAWQTALAGGMQAVLIAGEPGVGKTRLAGEWSRHAYEQGAIVLYGRCDEDLGAPYQPFAEALRSLIPCLGTSRLRGLRGIEALLPLVPGLTDVLPDLATPTRADADTERYALFDAVIAVLGVASASAPVVLILDDLHWAAKPTLLLLRHLLRFGEHARVQIVGTYRSTDLDRSHPLAAMLADLHRDGSATRLQLSGLDEVDVSAYVAEAGYDDEELARALASVTGGNPFFLIEALRHVDESGGRWDPSTLPQGVREAVSRRLSRLPAQTNKALAAAAVVGSRFALELVEKVVGDDLVDAFDEACKAGIVIEEPGGRYRFNHAIVRQSLLAELASVRRMRLHQSIAATLETAPGADDELLAELAHHYFECAWAGNAAKAVDYCRRAADQAMARLAYEGAADLYDHAVHALEEIDEELPDRDDQQAELLVARCEALLAAGDVVSAAGAVSQLQAATHDSPRLAAWGTCFDGQLSMLTDPERLDDIESALAAAAERLAELDDAAGEAKAHTVRAVCLARLGRIADAETALDHALTAARRAREHRRVNAVLANAPLAALWGPNPVPRAGGRCLDVVRLLRITTGSPVVEATSTRCQAVLDALRGRAAAGRSLLDSARRTLTELGMRHALLEVDQFAGILELVADDPGAAEPHLRRAYNGFRRMGLDADTAETAALLARACLALDRNSEANELCTESEHLAGHSLKPSIAWRTVRAQLLARDGAHDDARRMAEEAVAVAERTDLLVDHGDACLALATVLNIAGDRGGARTAAEKSVGLYELKGAAALAEKARGLLGTEVRAAPTAPEAPTVELDNACVRTGERVLAAISREAWDEVEPLFAPKVVAESHRKIVGFSQIDLPSDEWRRRHRRILETGDVRGSQVVIAVRGERLALARVVSGTPDVSPGAPQDEFLQLYGIDEEGRIALQVWFDPEDVDAAIAELDAAHARLEELQPRPPLENAASRVDHLFNTFFAERRWEDAAALWADDVKVEDRRRILRREETYDHATGVAEIRAMADLGVASMTSDIVAIRGSRLALLRTRYSGRDKRPDAFHTELLRVTEVGTDERCVATVAFDPDDLDAAFEELDARYLADEAAPHAQSWQTLMDTLGELNRHEMGPTLEGIAYVDHRRIPFAPGDFGRAIEDLWALVPDAHYRATAVHVLDARGAVISLIIEGTDTDGNELQWARVLSWVFAAARVDVYEADDLDAALARFEELQPQTRRLENAATRVEERFQASFAARDWAAMGEILADDISADDRRRVVNAGIRHGRDAKIADMRATADLGTKNGTSTAIAIRGQRLALVCIRLSGRDQRPDAFHTEMLGIVEINADNRMATRVLFDVDDIGAAFEELDARYLAGEAAAYAQTWSVVAEAYAAFNQRDLSATTPDWVNVDHRRGAAFAPGDMIAYIQAAWDDSPDTDIYIAAVHRLSNLGAVVTHVAHGISQEGFDAEWRDIHVLTVDGDMLSRSELFDEADLDAALERFDELSRPTPKLENTASRVVDRFQACFAASDWDAMAEILADDFSNDDRRPVVGAGIRQGRDAQIADMRAIADVGMLSATSTAVATRGKRLILTRARFSRRDHRTDEFIAEFLSVVETNADERIVAFVSFDPDDLDAAFAELDARYLAGEAAPYAHTWSLIARTYAGFNRGELPAATQDWVNVDHRHVAAMAPGEGIEYFHASWELTRDPKVYIEAVHRLSDLGAVFTHVGKGSSQAGFEAEWRTVDIMTVQGDLVSRGELFDVSDIDAALARFDELGRPSPRLENAASQVAERFLERFAARDWDAMAESLAVQYSAADRRRVVNAGIRPGRDAEIANMRAIADLGFTQVTSAVIATRGDRLALVRHRFMGRDQRPEAFHTEALVIVEIDADERIMATVVFEPDDVGAAFEELDARYLAGDAAPYAHTWAVLVRDHAAFNRRELPAKEPEFVDHRPLITLEAGDPTAIVRHMWDFTPDLRIYIEAVHRLSDVGAVVTQGLRGTSQDGFAAEWREINLLAVEGDLIGRSEIFDEEDIDAALARFDELSRPAPRLENAASQLDEHFYAHFAARDWDAMAEILADDYRGDDRRRVVGAGVRHGRDAEIVNMRAIADVGITNITSTVIATRGERLVLTRDRYSGRDQGPGAFHTEVLGIVEISADNRFVAGVWFDLDDIDAAFEELDARYLAGEAAAHAHTWSLVKGTYAALNRRELPATTPDWVTVDHRRVTTFAPGGLTAYLGATWDVVPNASWYVDAVHRLSNLGAVVTHTATGTSQDGFDAEWREIVVVTVDGDLFSRCEMFDEADLDAAVARFEELNRPAPRLENAASRAVESYLALFNTGEWDVMAVALAEEVLTDDRRRVVNAGMRHGRDVHVADMRAAAEVGAENTTSTVIATRGERLALCRIRAFNRNLPRDEVGSEMVGIAELDTDDRIAAMIAFDTDDIEAAFEELDARYVAGEAATHSRTWSVIAGAYAALNRHELPAVSPDWVNIDHRRAIAFARGDLTAYNHATWDLAADTRVYSEAVHRLSNVGAVVTQVGAGTSQQGSEAEWRETVLVTVDGDLINRIEIFDQADIDAALARFDELSRQTPKLENAASQVTERFQACFLVHDWAAMADLLAGDIVTDDRRRVVNAGVQHGRDALIADMQAAVEVGTENMTLTVIATRGERLVLNRVRASNRGTPPDDFNIELLGVVEIDADHRITALESFDASDIDAAFAELDARYLAGEAAAHAHTWSLIARTFVGLNRHEVPATTPDWVHIDRRPLAMYEMSELPTYLRATWDLTPQSTTYVEAVHQLTDIGAVLTNASQGTSHEGFEVEWRQICLITFEGDKINRAEVFDEDQIDSAIARFDQLNRPAPRLENAASRMYDRFNAYLVARDWDAMAEMIADDVCSDDRRRVVSAGIQRGRDAQIANLRAVVDVGVKNHESTVIATRGDRLALTRTRVSGDGQPDEAFALEMLTVIETDTYNRISAGVNFDLDDIDAAFGELDARYLAGEAAASANAWSVIAEAYAAFNRREMFPTTPNWVNLDHRRGTPFVSAGDTTAAIRAFWDLTPDFRMHVEAVHRLSDFGAVVTHTSYGTSREGFDAEWRMIQLLTVDGDRVDRFELFDEADLDTALARFDELQPQTRRLENAASRVDERFNAFLAARDWVAMAEQMSDDVSIDDRRRVVNAGIRLGRDAEIANLRAFVDLGVKNVATTVIATRGEHLLLSRNRFVGRNRRPDAFSNEALCVLEIDANERIVARVSFDPDDIDAAFEELDARYLAGEAAAHAHTWSLIVGAYAKLNRHELPAIAPDWVNIDRRRLATIEAGHLAAYVRASRDAMPELSIHVEAVHRLGSLGAVVTRAVNGTSQEGFYAEWREIDLLTVDGDRIDRCEIFDEADLDAALARFDELTRPAPRLENAASEAYQRFLGCFAARDWVALTELLAEDISTDDRRRVVGAGVQHGRDAQIADMRSLAEIGVNITAMVIATRGERLVLVRGRSVHSDLQHGEFDAEMLSIIEIDADDRIAAGITFDLDDVDAAFEELDARYLAGESAAYANTWSVITGALAAINRHELPELTPDWVNIDHRRAIAFAPGDMTAYMHATWDHGPDGRAYIEAVRCLSNLGAIVTHVGHEISPQGFEAEWRMLILLTVEGDRFNRCELFDEADIDSAIARFDELGRPTHQFENAATRIWTPIVDVFNRRDLSGCLALITADGQIDDRRKGLRAFHEGAERLKAVRALFDFFPESWRTEIDPIAIRGSRLSLVRQIYRDTDEADQPISGEALTLTEVSDDGRVRDIVLFDPDDINGAFDELTERWIASGEVAHPEVVEAQRRVLAATNRHDWDAVSAANADATYVNHRQLPAGGDTIADHMSSTRMMATLIPDLKVEPAQILTHSALGLLTSAVLRGTSTEGLPIEIPVVMLNLFDGDHLTRIEVFDPDQRDLALARFDELNRSVH